LAHRSLEVGQRVVGQVRGEMPDSALFVVRRDRLSPLDQHQGRGDSRGVHGELDLLATIFVLTTMRSAAKSSSASTSRQPQPCGDV
jgi:hypothetical protein